MKITTRRLLDSKAWIPAIKSLQDDLRTNSKDAEAWFALGCAQVNSGDLAAGASSLHRTLRLLPGHEPSLAGLTQTLVRLGRMEEALAVLEPAITGPFASAELLALHAEHLFDAYRIEAAEATIRRALSKRPEHVPWLELLLRIAHFASHQSAIEEASTLLHRHDPEHPEVINIRLSQALLEARWDEAARLEEIALRTWPSRAPHLFLGEGAFFRERPLLVPRPEIRPKAKPATPRAADGRTVIAYASVDFREHPVAHMLAPILAAHDQNRFEIVLATLGYWVETPTTAYLRQHSDRILDLTGRDDAQAAQDLRSAGVQVLVDISGPTKGSRPNIYHFRGAPHQFFWLGWPGTTSTANFDGVLLDKIVAPTGAEDCWSEPIFRLPTCYHPITTGVHEPLGPPRDRRSFGLPEHGLLFGLMQSPNRLRPSFLEALALTLCELPNVTLVTRISAPALEAAQSWFAARGVDPARVVRLPHQPRREDYLAALRCLDLWIDSIPYGGHSTTGEALALGIPVLTCRGHTMPGLVGCSMMTTLGLGPFIANHLDEAQAWLRRLATDQIEMLRWKAAFAQAATRVPESQIQLTRALEAIYHGHSDSPCIT